MNMRMMAILVCSIIIKHAFSADPGTGFPAPAAGHSASAPAATAKQEAGGSIIDKIEQYLAEQNLRQGYDPARKTYVDYHIVQCGVQPGNNGFFQARLMAFGRAELQAKSAVAHFLKQEVKAGRGLEFIEMPTLTPTEVQDMQVQNNPVSVLDRAILLANKKLDAALAEAGYTPAEKTLFEKAKNRYEQAVNIWAASMIRGAQILQTFEGEDAEGNWSIGVVLVWSPKLQALANTMFTGSPMAQPLPPGPPIAQQVPGDPSVLLATFGVRVLVNENGERVLLSYGQATPGSRLPTAKSAAQQKAYSDAVRQLRQFASESISSELMMRDTETLQELLDTTTGETAISVTQSQAFQQKVASTSEALKMQGVTPIRRWEARHPSGDLVVGCVVAWSSDSVAAARELQSAMQSSARPGGPAPVQTETKPANDGTNVQVRGVYEGAGGALDAF